MTWVKIDDRFPDHPKALDAGPAAAWLYVCGLCYASRYLTDGFIPAVQVARLADLKHADKLARRLIDVGLWEVAEGGYQVHDYLDYQRSAAEVDGVSAKRAEAGRRGGVRSGEARREANAKQVASLGLEANAKQNRSRVQSTEIDRSSSPSPSSNGAANGADDDDFSPTYETTLGPQWSKVEERLAAISPEFTDGTVAGLFRDVERLVGPLPAAKLRSGVEAGCTALQRKLDGERSRGKPVEHLVPYASKIFVQRLKEVSIGNR